MQIKKIPKQAEERDVEQRVIDAIRDRIDQRVITNVLEIRPTPLGENVVLKGRWRVESWKHVIVPRCTHSDRSVDQGP